MEHFSCPQINSSSSGKDDIIYNAGSTGPDSCTQDSNDLNEHDEEFALLKINEHDTLISQFTSWEKIRNTRKKKC